MRGSFSIKANLHFCVNKGVCMRFTKRHYRAQVDARDCGVAALAMIYGYYGSYYSLASLREMAKTTLR